MPWKRKSSAMSIEIYFCTIFFITLACVHLVICLLIYFRLAALLFNTLQSISTSPIHSSTINAHLQLPVLATDCTGSCKSNYHTTTTTTVPFFVVSIRFYLYFFLQFLNHWFPNDNNDNSIKRLTWSWIDHLNKHLSKGDSCTFRYGRQLITKRSLAMFGHVG